MKYLDHMNHVIAHGRFKPVLHITGDGRIDALEQYIPHGIERVELPFHSQAIYLAGTDWEFIDNAGQDISKTPVINLIQGIRHSQPDTPHFQYLNRPAIRICVSKEVTKAIKSTQRVSGPIRTIPNGINLSELKKFKKQKRNGKVLIVGYKSPKLAADIDHDLQLFKVPHDTLTSRLPRPEYLEKLSQYSHVIMLPRPTEGFYLPALEALALGVTVIMPDCVGARSFAIDQQTCVIAQRHPFSLATEAAQLYINTEKAIPLQQKGLKICNNYSIEKERQRLFKILDELKI